MWPFGKNAKGRLEDALEAQELTAKLNLDVKVEKKTAIVAGEVPNERYKNLITAIANGINGIEEVDVSGLRVSQAAAAQSGTMDSGDAASAGQALDDPSA